MMMMMMMMMIYQSLRLYMPTNRFGSSFEISSLSFAGFDGFIKSFVVGGIFAMFAFLFGHHRQRNLLVAWRLLFCALQLLWFFKSTRFLRNYSMESQRRHNCNGKAGTYGEDHTLTPH